MIEINLSKSQADDDNWGDDDEDDGDWCEDVSEEAVKQRMKELTSGVQVGF